MKILADISFEELCERYDECYEYIHDANQLLRSFNGVIGIGIGPKMSGGRLLPEQPCFLVYVQEKRARTDLDTRELIPKEILGITTDVVAIGSRDNASHNEFDARWLQLSREDFIGFCKPDEESGRHLS